MACIKKIYSVSAVLGGPECNANCPGCAGRALRNAAAKIQDPNKAPRNIVAASRLALGYGAWSLALTSSGEPTLYPEAITDTLRTLKNNGVQWPFINLFTNGIRIANEGKMRAHLTAWRDLGLTSVALSVHSVDDSLNAVAYGFTPGAPHNPTPKKFYKLADAIKVVQDTGLCCRIVLLLGRDSIASLGAYVQALDTLHDLGIGLVTAWELRTNDGRRMAQTISWWEALKIRLWLFFKTKAVMGHAWGGMVRSYRGMNVRLTDYVSKHSSWNNYIRQLVVLPGGTVSYSWFQEGMFCLD